MSSTINPETANGNDASYPAKQSILTTANFEESQSLKKQDGECVSPNGEYPSRALTNESIASDSETREIPAMRDELSSHPGSDIEEKVNCFRQLFMAQYDTQQMQRAIADSYHSLAVPEPIYEPFREEIDQLNRLAASIYYQDRDPIGDENKDISSFDNREYVNTTGVDTPHVQSWEDDEPISPHFSRYLRPRLADRVTQKSLPCSPVTHVIPEKDTGEDSDTVEYNPDEENISPDDRERIVSPRSISNAAELKLSQIEEGIQALSVVSPNYHTPLEIYEHDQARDYSLRRKIEEDKLKPRLISQFHPDCEDLHYSLEGVVRLRYPAGTGFLNTGNICYISSILQCLMWCHTLHNEIDAFPHGRENAQFCGFCALRECYFAYFETNSHLSISFARDVHLISESFYPHRQEDAHEFLIALLNSVAKSEMFGCIRSMSRDALPAWEEQHVVRSVFGGLFGSVLWCDECQYTSQREESFLDLSLQISGLSSLHEALDDFTETEKFCGDDQMTCDDCGTKVDGTKVLTILRPPRVLIVQLKRFHDNGKDERMISFPEELDISPYVHSDCQKDMLTYELSSIVTHHGSGVSTGHYTAFIRDHGGRWWDKNDSRTTPATREDVLGQKAYILFYTMRNDDDIAGFLRDKTILMKREILQLDIASDSLGSEDHHIYED